MGSPLPGLLESDGRFGSLMATLYVLSSENQNPFFPFPATAPNDYVFCAPTDRCILESTWNESGLSAIGDVLRDLTLLKAEIPEEDGEVYVANASGSQTRCMISGGKLHFPLYSGKGRAAYPTNTIQDGGTAWAPVGPIIANDNGTAAALDVRPVARFPRGFLLRAVPPWPCDAKPLSSEDGFFIFDALDKEFCRDGAGLGLSFEDLAFSLGVDPRRILNTLSTSEELGLVRDETLSGSFALFPEGLSAATGAYALYLGATLKCAPRDLFLRARAYYATRTPCNAFIKSNVDVYESYRDDDEIDARCKMRSSCLKVRRRPCEPGCRSK